MSSPSSKTASDAPFEDQGASNTKATQVEPYLCECCKAAKRRAATDKSETPLTIVPMGCIWSSYRLQQERRFEEEFRKSIEQSRIIFEHHLNRPRPALDTPSPSSTSFSSAQLPERETEATTNIEKIIKAAIDSRTDAIVDFICEDLRSPRAKVITPSTSANILVEGEPQQKIPCVTTQDIKPQPKGEANSDTISLIDSEKDISLSEGSETEDIPIITKKAAKAFNTVTEYLTAYQQHQELLKDLTRNPSPDPLEPDPESGRTEPDLETEAETAEKL